MGLAGGAGAEDRQHVVGDGERGLAEGRPVRWRDELCGPHLRSGVEHPRAAGCGVVGHVGEAGPAADVHRRVGEDLHVRRHRRPHCVVVVFGPDHDVELLPGTQVHSVVHPSGGIGDDHAAVDGIALVLLTDERRLGP